LEAQLADGLALCEARGLGEPVIYQDAGKSASDPKRKRPGFEQLLADVKAGKINRIVCRDDDRLVRRPIELERIIDVLEPRNVPVYFTHASELDLTTPDGRLRARIMGTVARYEVENKSKRQKQANQKRLANGQPYPTVRPFGYQIDRGTLVKVPEEADAIVWAADHVLKGGTLSEVAREWNRRGLKTAKHKNDFDWQAARYVMLNPYICGYRGYQPSSILSGEGTKRVPAWKHDLYRGNWEPIISRETWDAVKLILTRSRSKAGNRLKHLGSGIYLCGVCDDGTTLRSGYAVNPGKRHRIYKCRNGSHISTKADPIDEYVEAEIHWILSAPGNFADYFRTGDTHQVDEAALRAERDELERDLSGLAASFAARKIRLSQLEEATASINRRIDEIDELLAGSSVDAEVASRYADPDRVLKAWNEATIEIRRQMLKDILPRIVVYPTGRRRGIPVAVYVHVFDRRGRRRPLPEGPEEAAIAEAQDEHAARYRPAEG
jgi:DNA invertase Pin-like site-specific DNA recombinase